MPSKLDDPRYAWAVLWGLLPRVAVIFDSALEKLEHRRRRKLSYHERMELGVKVIELLEEQYKPDRK